MHLFGDTASDYRGFAAEAGDSPTFAAWAAALADDPDVLAWLETLPALKRQPNLLFAAARWHGVPAPGPYAALRAAVLDDDGSLRESVLTRSTQTNEAGRMASLAPVLGLVQREDPRPLALLEVGASAGLCLYPDRYDYRWAPLGECTGSGGPVLGARASGPLPVPQAPLRVASRSGIDLHPLDVTDADDLAWLRVLVWPEHDERRARLDAAAQVTRSDPPRLVAGDLLELLPRELDRLVAAEVCVVVQHSAVIAYLEPDDRRRFVKMMRAEVAAGRCRWVSNEAPGVLPGLPQPGRSEPHRFVVALDGTPLALSHPHGSRLDWLG